MSTVSAIKESSTRSSDVCYDAVVIGAGPYGLTAAAHLLGQGLRVAIFGKPLELWRKHMPDGMFLRSHWWAASMADPQKRYTFERFFAHCPEYQPSYPVPIEIYIAYGLWFQRNAVPQLDETYVTHVERLGGEFSITLEDNRVVRSKTVIMAPGLSYYANRPAEYGSLAAKWVSHSFDHKELHSFAGKRVVVVGGGQSAVEYSALLAEAGASAVHLVSRRAIHWLAPDRYAQRSGWEKVRAPDATIAPGWKNWILDHFPYLFYFLPQARKERYLRSYSNSAAAAWLRPRVIGHVQLYEEQRVTHVEVGEQDVTVMLSSGELLQADHILLATGYEVNLTKLSMLDPALLALVQMERHIPVLNRQFESTVPGLYFIGLSSARAFGPLYRFVGGCTATGQRVARAVAHQIADLSSR